MYGQPHRGTVQSGSSNFTARAPASATDDLATVLGARVMSSFIIATTAGAGEPSRARCDTCSCSREAIAQPSIPPRLWPTMAIGPWPSCGTSDRSISVRNRSGHPALIDTPERTGRYPIRDSHERSGRRYRSLPNSPGMTSTVRPSPRGTPRP